MLGEKALGPGVLIIAGHFAPENVSGTHRSIHFARALHDAGWPVTVLTVPTDGLKQVDLSLHDVFPHEDRVVRVPLATTVGDYYLALKRRLSKAQRRDGGIQGTHRPSPTDDSVSSLRAFLRCWSRFPDAYRAWYRPALTAGIALANQYRIGAVFASGPPWTGLMAAYGVARRAGIPLVTDFRDPWTTTMGQGSFPKGFWDSVGQRRERRIVKASEVVLVNSPQVLAAARRSYPRAAGGPVLELVLNGTDAPRSTAEAPLPQQCLEIRHFGSLYHGRSISPLHDALVQLTRAEGHSGQIVLEQVGATEEPLPQSFGGIEVRHRGTVPHSEALRLMRRTGVLLVVQPPVYNPQIPTKMFEYLATGNPLLVLADETSAAWELSRAYPRCLRLDHTDRAHNIDTLDRLLRNWRAGTLRQSRAVEDTAGFTRIVAGKEFVAIIERVTEAPKAPGSAGRTRSDCSIPRSPITPDSK